MTTKKKPRSGKPSTVPDSATTLTKLHSASIRVEKGIPVPDDIDQRSKYPWKDMDVGDSFFVENGDKKTISSVAHGAGKRLKRKFRAKDDVTDGVAGIRVWRTE